VTGNSPGTYSVLFVLLALFVLLIPSPILGQPTIPDAPCGVVDDIGYPVDSMVERTIERGYDDFGAFRARWGGHHVGLDVAFREQGAPVYAAARGRVTYSDIEGWDTERGVVIIEHIFPNGEIYYTLYGHIEETDDIILPQVGACVELGDVIAAVGWPSMSAPHVHYEVRDFMPDDGGPGYVEGNPLALGWYHPLDFTHLWKLKLSPAYRSHITFDLVPTLPPVRLSNGTIAIASGDVVAVVAAPGVVLWRVNMDDLVSGLGVLPDNRVVARSRSGQTATLAGGRYAALWSVGGPDVPFTIIGETLIFPVGGGGLAAYDPLGQPLWSMPAPEGDTGRVLNLQANGSTVALLAEDGDGYLWRMTDAHGTPLYEATSSRDLLAAPVADGSWALLADGELLRVTAGGNEVIGTVAARPGRTAQLAADIAGNTYYYSGDARSTLISWDAGANRRWEADFAEEGSSLLSPLLATDQGCLVYGLNSSGQLNVYDARSGELVEQVWLYAGGDRSRRPASRMLTPGSDGTLHVSAGFLTLFSLDARLLAAGAVDDCLPG
jgi:murein DD-endopeptidase MepM/ murein hydrolase activator NlpD